ncbi:MAG: acyl-CoA dehydrogenase family protein [Nevskiales bacterium]
MNFKFSDEQQQLRDTLQRFIRKDYSFEKRREIIRSPEGISRAVWKQLADMGVLALTLPETYGGLGGNAVDTLVVVEEFGRGMVVEPYLSTVVIGAELIARAGSGQQRTELLPKVAAGELLLAFAHYEPNIRYELNHVATQAKNDKDGYLLSGAKTMVLHGAAADLLIVSARTAGKARDAGGISLFLVDPKARGVVLQRYPTQDGQQAAELQLDKVHVGKDALLGQAGHALPLIEHATDSAIAALCAEAVGNMAALIETTLVYVKTRKQFGVPIGAFQALQHRMADMLMLGEQARSMAYLAAAKLDVEDVSERRRALAAAKALVGQTARFIGQQAVQLHGGIGMTDELAVSHYFKRLTMINASFGDADHHLARFSDMILAEQTAAQSKRSPQLKRA